MIIYKCDVDGTLSESDVLPSDWTTLSANGPQGAETPAHMKVRHLCNKHTLEKLLKGEIA